jgi:hypothetical protein
VAALTATHPQGKYGRHPRIPRQELRQGEGFAGDKLAAVDILHQGCPALHTAPYQRHGAAIALPWDVNELDCYGTLNNNWQQFSPAALAAT